MEFNKKKFMKIVFLLALLYFIPFLSYAFDSIEYDITASVDSDQHGIKASEKVSFHNNHATSFDAIYFRVYPHHKISKKEKRNLYLFAAYFNTSLFPAGFDPGSFEIESIRRHGSLQDLVWTYEGEDETLLRVNLDKALTPNEDLSLDVQFSSRIPHRIGRYGWHKNTIVLNRWYPILAPFKHDQWFKAPDYLLHMPYSSEAASYRLVLNYPKDYVVASGCDEVQSDDISGERKTLTLSSSQPLRELSLALSSDFKIYENEKDGVKIRSFYFAGDEGMARHAANFAAETLDYYGRHMGAYPYKQLSIAPVYLGYGGNQNAGVIFIDSKMYKLPLFLLRYFNFLITHETGHQWWYNIVGNDEFSELWLDEGINSYWTMQFLKHKYGANALVVDLPQWTKHLLPNPTFEETRIYRYRYLISKGIDQPILGELSGFNEPSMVFSLAYGKGSVVLDMLSVSLGSLKLNEIMRSYFEKERFKIADVKSFIDVCEEETGKELDWFFNEWLYQSHHLDYAIVRRDKKLVLENRSLTQMPVEVQIEFEDGTSKLVSIEGAKEQEVLDDQVSGQIKSVEIDPNRLLLDVDRLNNHWPRRFERKIVPLYHDLYEMPVFLSDDAYHWITGPSFSSYGFGLKSSFQKLEDYIIYAASYYDSSSESINSFVGFEKRNFLKKFLSWGLEVLNRDTSSNREDDLTSYKLYLRAELDFPYGIKRMNSHLTFFLLHNQRLGQSGFLGSMEDSRGLQYRKNRETICGVTFYSSSAGPQPDPAIGSTLLVIQEAAGHFLGGKNAYFRTIVEYDQYREIGKAGKVAFRVRGGKGSSRDKYLFYLGSDTLLRGYDYKSIQGSSCLMTSLEWRFPLLNDLDFRSPMNLFTFDALQGVLFFDGGTSWYRDFDQSRFRKDIGLGLRFYFDIIGASERVALRIDIARPLDGEDRDTHVWVGINHAF